MRFRIMREVKTRAGIALRDVPHPLQTDTDGCYMSADSPEAALANLRPFRDTRGLVAVPEAN